MNGWRVVPDHNLAFVDGRFEEVTCRFLEETRQSRSSSSVPPEETSANDKVLIQDHEARDVFGVGALVRDVLAAVTNEGTGIK